MFRHFSAFFLLLGSILLPILVVGRTNKEEAVRYRIERLSKALSAFKRDVGRFPKTIEGLSPLVLRPADLANWHGPYLNNPTVSLDSWGNPYVYFCPPKYGNDAYDLYSSGQNRIDEHGGGDDLANWR